MNRQNAGLPRRFGAILYDALLVLALLFVTTIPFIAMRGGEPVNPDDNLAYQTCLAVVVYVFFTGFWTYKGRTLGMQSWRLRVETPTGELPSLAQATARFFGALLSVLPLGLGFFWQLFDEDGLTWHDRLSGTRLVHYPKQKAN
jgi:uncharacterized RDD family membrane protein YckC